MWKPDKTVIFLGEKAPGRKSAWLLTIWAPLGENSLKNLQWIQLLLLLCLCFHVQMLSIRKRSVLFCFIYILKKLIKGNKSFLWNEMQLFWCVWRFISLRLLVCSPPTKQNVLYCGPACLLLTSFCCLCVSCRCLRCSSTGGAENMSQKVNVSFSCVIWFVEGRRLMSAKRHNCMFCRYSWQDCFRLISRN